jgi:serine/threonine-protein kinase
MDSTVPDFRSHTHPGLDNRAATALSPRYDLLGEVGRGSMGVVYKARQRTLDRLVALKVMLPGASTDRFLREARLLAQIRSPNVVTVHDCEVLPDGQPMLVMEWVEGSNLAEVMGRTTGQLPEDVVLP